MLSKSNIATPVTYSIMTWSSYVTIIDYDFYFVVLSDITSLNIRLNERTFRMENLQKDVMRTKDRINQHGDDMNKITMTL